MAKIVKNIKHSALINALKFVSLAQRNQNSPGKDYCHIENGLITATDGMLTAGISIEEDLNCNPHSGKLLAALNQCGDDLSITQLEGNKLSIKSGKFSCVIPCYTEDINISLPDDPTFPLSPAIKNGFEVVSHLTKENAATVLESSIQLKSGSLISTNGIVALEYWHGLELPCLILPKTFVEAINSINIQPIKLGYSNSTCTFWFNENQWIKTQLYGEKWPEIDNVFNPPANLNIQPLPTSFYEAVHSVEAFTEEGKNKGVVYLSQYGISSHKDTKKGAIFELEGLQDGCFAIAQLKNIEKCCKSIGFTEEKAYFFGNNVRGVIMGIKL